MDLKDMKFKITTKDTNQSFIIGWENIFGYEGASSESGVWARVHVPDEKLRIKVTEDIRLTSNTGDIVGSLNENIDIELVDTL